MTLGDKQRLFCQLVGLLIVKAYQLGYGVTFGEAYRPAETAALYAKQGRGIENSNHCNRLAIDLNLFRDREYLIESEDHRELGEWWENQNDLCCWGGRWGDGNHYSLEHNGRK